MQIESEHKGEALVLKAQSDRLGADNAVEFKKQVSEHLKDPQGAIVLDISRLMFIDSTGVGAIISVLKLIGNKGQLLIAGPTDSVQQLFKLTRMDKVLRIHPSVESALQSVDPRPV